ncbi:MULTISPECIES: DNA cytosine methyltransferase [Acinetobacter]|uniref:DNA cytosine methyltransferase n=1 Tax=Acinetobacter TaxID=469 RepID=UPI000EA2FFD5|nr:MULTISPECIES: DNA cytosine methyltransferase [Acinetobacter]RKG45145.1 DNA cytosine methyltransferase [Acinetobacter cumulans]RZG60117.1 DNA cytosine methyltransferase [Acinetobacter sp. WCHAc060006]
MNELALFAGAGGGILGSHLLGWNTICAVERDAYAAQILAQRQNDGILPSFPIWSDVCSFDGKPWRGIIDVISGGFPCQDISSAGKGAGIDGARSGMWAEMARIIGEVRPRYVFVENSPMLVSRGLTRVISDLAKMGYDAQWARFSASNFGAPHERDRLWIVANANGERFSVEDFPSRLQKKITGFGGNDSNMADAKSFGRQQARKYQLKSEKWTTRCSNEFSNTDSIRCEQMEQSITCRTPSKGLASQTEYSSFPAGRSWWAVEPGLGRVADGVAHRVDRLKAIGNGQVPIVAKSAFEYLRNDK